MTTATTMENRTGVLSASTMTGSRVTNPSGEDLGKIENLMLDLDRGRVAYAVLSFGGFLGIGEKFSPLPWSVLTYDTNLGGYAVDLDRDRLQGAPSYSSTDADRWSEPGYARSIDEYYGTSSSGSR